MIECPRCHRENADDALHCATCRAYLGWTRSRREPTAAPPAAPPPIPPMPPVPPTGAAPPAAGPATGRSSTGPSAAETVPDRSAPAPEPNPWAPPPRTGGFATVRRPDEPFTVRRVSQPARTSPWGRQPAPAGTDVGAVLPQETGPSTPSTWAGPATSGFAPPAPGGTACPRCGRGVPDGRRFCRCGASLVPPPTPAQDEQAERRPWYRRIRDAFGTGRSFKQAMLQANGGARWAYDAAISARAQFVRLTFVLAAVGIGVSQFGPWSPDLRAKAKQQVDRVLPHQYGEVAVESVGTEPKTADPPGFEVRFATDGNTSRVWGTPWHPVQAAGPPCQRPAGAPALVIAFRKPSDLDRVVIRAGLPADNDRRTSQARPRIIDLRLADGGCRQLDLADTAGPQTFDLKARGTTFVQLLIVEVYPPADQGDDLVSLAEVTFQARR